MTNSRLPDMTARIHAAMKAAGMAEGGTTLTEGAKLRRKNGSEVPCRVFVTLNAQRIGGDGGVMVLPAQVEVLLADLAGTVPVKGDAFVVGAQLFKVDAPVEGGTDEAIATLHCLPGVPA